MKAFAQDEHNSPGVKNHRVVVSRHGEPDVLQVVEEELPEPGANEVRVRVLAAGVSAYDLMFRRVILFRRIGIKERFYFTGYLIS